MTDDGPFDEARLAALVSRDAVARQAFDRLPSSYRKEYLDWIAGAAKDATRERHLEKMIAMLKGKA